MINNARTPLHRRIEADETIVGGPVRGVRGRGVTVCATKTLVFGAVEVATFINTHGVSCEKAGRLRLSMPEQANEKSIKNFLVTHVEKGSTVCTDGWRGYSKTALKEYCHQTNPDFARHIHRTYGNLKTWLNGTYHGVSPKYLQTYLHKFVF